MALGPFANMPDLFPKSTVEDLNAFKTLTHDIGYQPTAHTSGWRTSSLRDYVVTYSYSVTLTRMPQLSGQKEQEIDSSDEMVVEVHALDYCPPTRESGWHTSTGMEYTVTYCWDFDPKKRWQDSNDEDRNSIGITDSETELQDNTDEEDEDSGNGQWAKELQEFNEMGINTTPSPIALSKSQDKRQEYKRHSGIPESQSEAQGNEEDGESYHSDSTDWEKELRGVVSMEKTIIERPDAELELRERRHPVSRIEMGQIHEELPYLDHPKLTRLFEYLEMDRPGTLLASDTRGIDLASFSQSTLRKIHDIILESLLEIEEGERETRYLGTVRDVLEARVVAPRPVVRSPVEWEIDVGI